VTTSTKQAFRPVNRAFLAGLEMVSTKIYPLPGGTGRRQGTGYDPRLTNLAGLTPVGENVTYYEHIATMRHKGPPEQFFVAFRETMDAFLARQTDPQKFPEWLMKSPEKQSERNVHIYVMTRHPKNVPVLHSHEDWLAQITDVSIFDTLAQFLAHHSVIDDKVLRKMR
jgi:hypothetical protein